MGMMKDNSGAEGLRPLGLRGRAYGVKDFSHRHEDFILEKSLRKTLAFTVNLKTWTVFAFASVCLNLGSFQAFFESDWVTFSSLGSLMILYRKRSRPATDPHNSGVFQRISREFLTQKVGIECNRNS